MSRQIGLADYTEKVFRKVLPSKMQGYESREPQIKLARMIATGLESNQVVMAEAGTGTGKSLALLVPAIEHANRVGKPVIVSTGTIALQEQYTKKDTPFLQQVLEPFKATLAKGKGNYVCQLRLESETQQAAFSFGEDPIIEWALSSETGDLNDYPGQPSAQWHQINVDETCVGAKCPFYDTCHYFRAKREAAEAQIIVCNHHLFFADMQVRSMSGGYASVLPDACAVIFDEAHHIESIARSSLGAQVTSFWVTYWNRQVRRLPLIIDDGLFETAEQANQDLFYAIASAMGDENKGEVPTIDPSLVEGLSIALGAIRKEMREQLDTLSDEDAGRAERLHDQALEFMSTVRSVISKETDDNTIAWAEIEDRSGGWKATLHITPIDVAAQLSTDLFAAYPSVVMTSATLSVDRSFEHLRSRIGAQKGLELIVPSPFEYREQCLLYSPRPESLPDPRDGDYHIKIAPLIERLLTTTRGRAFVLFTSYYGMQCVYDLLHRRLPYQVIKQGDAPRSTLLEHFRADKHSVLFGTKSFWEGVDVQGEALSCVILDKLPFASPGDPVSKATADAVDKQGGSAFFDLILPEAIITTKQGFGRLIRSRTDRGVVAILDRRIRSMSYGRMFLASLPPARRVERLADVAAFMAAEREGVAS